MVPCVCVSIQVCICNFKIFRWMMLPYAKMTIYLHFFCWKYNFYNKIGIFLLLYLLTHRRTLVFSSWETRYSEEPDAEQIYKQLPSQSWWMWMSVRGNKCSGMAGKGRAWLSGKQGVERSGAALAEFFRDKRAKRSPTLNGIKLLCLVVCVHQPAWFSLY